MSELELENSGTCSSGALILLQDTEKLPDAEKPSLKKMIDEMKPCSVVLEKLSEGVINDYLSRIDLNFVKQERAKKKFAKHKLRYMSKINYHLFEKYKNTRQKFINKERRRSEDYADEDFDPERYFSDGRCRKKRSRRKPAYEDDYDWDPSEVRDKYANKGNRSAYSPKRLRRIMKRPISESESSSSDFFDFLLEEEKEDFSENELSASRSAGVSFGNISQAIKNTQITNAAKDTAGGQTEFNTSKVLSKAISDSISLNLNSESSENNDVVSKIMKDMDNLKSTKDVNKICQHPNTSLSNREKLNKNVVLRPTGQVRKRSKMRNPDVRVVRAILNNMVNSVCSAENKRLRNIVNSNNNKKKKCKWCATLFTSSNKNDVYCMICKDTKSGYLGKSVYKKQNKSKSNEKNSGTAKATNSKNKMMDKLRKNMPKYDIQRLIYTDKAAVEKGYNHCKSFSIPKDEDVGIATFSNPCTFSKEQQSDKISNKGNTQKKKNNQPNILVNATVTSGKSTLKKANPSKAKKVSKDSPAFILSSHSKKINENKKINANKVCVTNVDKGLFLMTFPEPDKELDVNMLKESTLENANNVNRSTVIKMATDKIESKKDLPPNMKKIQQPETAVKNLQFGTYLLPPVPTVVVANYAAADDSNGDFYLSSVYYQNEMTQQKGALVDSVVVRNENLNNNIVKTSLPPSMPTGTDLINMSNASIFPTSQNNILMPVGSLSDGSFIKTVDIVSNSGTKSSELARHLTLPVTDLNQFAHSNDSFSSENCHTSETQNCFSSENQLIPNVPNMNSEMSLLEMNSESIAQDQDSTKEQIINDFDLNNTNPYAALDTSTSNSNMHVNLNITSNADRDTSSKIGLPEGNSSLSELDEVSLSSDTAGINANSPENLLTEAYQEIEAISILGVVDLDKNPHVMLAYRIEVVKKQYEQLVNQKDKVVDERLGDIRSQYVSLLLAKKLLSKFRSFARVSEYYLGKEKLIQIKKEKIVEEDNERPACQYSKNSVSASNELANFVGEESVSSASVKTDQINKSCSLADDASSVNHIEKIQSQIAAINETSSPNDHVPVSVMHHFPAPSNSSVVTVSTPVTPGNELGNDSRETPSRGSGPRTPARPESATSQLEESMLTPAQVKKERLETVTSPFSQCVYSVSSSSPHLTTPSPNMSQVTSPLANMRLANSVSVTVSNNNLPQFQNMTYSQNKDIPPNRTVPFNTNQNLSKVLLNLATHQQQIQNTNPNMNINNPQNSVVFNNGKVINVQQIYLPGGARFAQKVNVQPVPSISNTNQYILRQTSMNTTSANGGTVLVNNNHVGAQNIWHGNEANPQVFAPQQVSQVYNPSPTQMTVSASHQQSSSPAFAVQNKQPAAESTEQMVCAVCKSAATLRCKQCAKVAYCNTTCAKTYWHKKHKMECKAMTNLI